MNSLKKAAVVYVTNVPAPYREAIHQRVSESLNGNYHVIYCHEREPDRLWEVSLGTYNKSFLKASFVAFRGRFIHANFDVWPALNRLNPSVVITTGFNPTYLLALLWCMINRRKHIVFNDGWLRSEQALTFIHISVRKFVYRRSKAFLGPSRHTMELYRHFGCPEEALFQSHLCANNDLFMRFVQTGKSFDIVFSGQFIERKMPLFFAEVIKRLKAKKPDLRVLLLGDGPLRLELLEALRKTEVDFHFAGYVAQANLPAHYASAKLLLFPTLLDPWGVVANEACAAGVPVITCPNAGVAGDLIVDGYNGYVLDTDAATWCEHAWKLLNDDVLRNTFSRRALQKVQEYNYDAAAKGILEAVQFALLPRIKRAIAQPR
jgi:glycosyltransferase involved in cell wall biosynthesis